MLLHSSRSPTRLVLAILTVIWILVLYANYGLLNNKTEEQHPQEVNSTEPPLEPWDSSRFLNGPPAPTFRENLRNDTHYVTSWTDGGFTNEFMTYVNLIYLATLSSRVPVVPPFAPFHHMSSGAGLLPFGAVFDLPHLRRAIRSPVLEWHEVKQNPVDPTANAEPLGCWSAWLAGNRDTNSPRVATNLIVPLGLDVSQTPLPQHTKGLTRPEDNWDWYLLFWPIAALIHPSSPTWYNENASPAMAPHSSAQGHHLPPDTHMTCFDLLYFVKASKEPDEWNYSWCPAWRFVGQYLRFQPELSMLAQSYVARAFRLSELQPLPPFIAVHVRHGDFQGWCPKDIPKTECWATLPTYAKRVKEVQRDLLRINGVHVLDRHVLLTSDETDPQFWSEVAALGWARIDHEAEQTLAKHGEWYSTIIDTVIQSLATGFVGTDQSTVSRVSQRRVEDWNQGITRIVKWGRPGADDR